MSKVVGQAVKKTPVYIMSPMQRCGTNHLADILLLHPDFQVPKALEEDFVVEYADLLHEYSEKTYQHWRRLEWVSDLEEHRRLLQHHLGQGILAFLGSQIDATKRPLHRSPDCHNIDKFFLFFPGVKLLLLIRDGRDVVESAARKWPQQSYEHWMRKWAEGARRLLNFIQQTGREMRGKSWELVRYEELVERPEIAVKGMLEFLDIDVSTFAWDRLTHLPVRGSSSILDAHGKVSKETVEKLQEFSPIGRWHSWSGWRKRKFKKLAERELLELGYESTARW
jgi:protein-tyrosine sulfotransferase